MIWLFIATNTEKYIMKVSQMNLALKLTEVCAWTAKLNGLYR